jgi:hypothetical protein
MDELKLKLFKKIYTHCVENNVLIPEYELYLKQEIYTNLAVIKHVAKWLLKITPDKDGWYYVLISDLYDYIKWSPEKYHTVKKDKPCRCEINDVCKCNEISYEIKEKENDILDVVFPYDIMHYLQQGARCGNKICISAYEYQLYKIVDTNDRKTHENNLEQLHLSGNKYAKMFLFKINFPTTNINQYLISGAEMGNICCMKQIVEHNAMLNYHEHDFGYKKYWLTLIKWGYNKIVWRIIKDHYDEVKQAAERLIELGIPCGYHLLSFVSCSYPEKIQYLHKGMDMGCSCYSKTNESNEHKYMYTLHKKIDDLQKLQNMCLDDIFKNIISQYL